MSCNMRFMVKEGSLEEELGKQGSKNMFIFFEIFHRFGVNAYSMSQFYSVQKFWTFQCVGPLRILGTNIAPQKSNFHFLELFWNIFLQTPVNCHDCSFSIWNKISLNCSFVKIRFFDQNWLQTAKVEKIQNQKFFVQNHTLKCKFKQDVEV